MAVRRRSRARISTILLVIWLLIGVLAAVQRGYFGSAEPSCSRIGSAALTIITGPLNYLGLDPEIGCSMPQPSE